MRDFEKWLFEMNLDCDEIDIQCNEKCLNELYDNYYLAKSKGDKNSCKAIAIDFYTSFPMTGTTYTTMIQEPTTGIMIKKQKPVELLMWASINHCMSKKDRENFFFIPQEHICNGKYKVDFAFFKFAEQGEAGDAFLAVECDDYHGGGNEREREIQFHGVEVLRIPETDIYVNPIGKAKKILNHIRGKYF